MWTLLLACSDSDPVVPVDSQDPTAGDPLYDDPAHWLCRPEVEGDPCDSNLDVTAVNADGSLEVLTYVPVADPIADCFYVYPTTSLDPVPQSDWLAGPEENFVVTIQAARYGAVCRLYAPLYRQVTINGLFAEEGDFELAYSDVLAAFRSFLEKDNAGRPFLLVGHSQGSMHLSRLIAEEIEGDAALSQRMIAAHLIGGFVEVPQGQSVGGTFQSTPLCESSTDTGCVVHYNSYRLDDPPGDDAVFSRATIPGDQIACTNPAALQGGEATLGAVLPTETPTEVAALLGPQPGPFADPEQASVISTPFFSLPGLVQGSCTSGSDTTYLAISVQSDPTDPRADDIGGDLLPGWGLHLVDVSLAGLDLIDLAREQIDAWAQSR